MGIKNLSAFLKKRNLYTTTCLSDLKYKKVAIDTPKYIYLYKYAHPDSLNWLGCFATLIGCLRKWDIHPTFVLEGVAPAEKIPTQLKRKADQKRMVEKTSEIEADILRFTHSGVVTPLLSQVCAKERAKGAHRPLLTKTPFDLSVVQSCVSRRKRGEFSVTREDLALLAQLFCLLGVNVIQAPSEAETMCVQLLFSGLVDAIVSEDTDVLAYTFEGDIDFFSITTIDFENNTVTGIRKSDVLNELKLTDAQFRDFCIMCGTDYNNNIPNIGVVNAFKLITEHGSIEQVVKALPHEDASVLNYTRSRELFTTRPIEPPVAVDWCDIPDSSVIDELGVFCFKNDIRNVDARYVYHCMSEWAN